MCATPSLPAFYAHERLSIHPNGILCARTAFYSPERLSIHPSGVLHREYDVRVGEAGGGGSG